MTRVAIFLILYGVLQSLLTLCHLKQFVDDDDDDISEIEQCRTEFNGFKYRKFGRRPHHLGFHG